MSKDQLSWEQILAGVSPETAAPETAAPVAAPSVTESVAAPSIEPIAELATPKKKRAKKASSKLAEPSDDTTQYSKKNWDKLEFGTPAVVPQNAAEVKAEPPRSPPAVAVKKTEPVVVEPPPPVKSNEPDVITVSQLNKHIREILEGRFPTIWLKGEISNFKGHTSGHFYFSLKDAKAQISAVMFRGYNSALRFRPEDGMEVLVRGKITVYEPRGNYQMFCEVMEPVGAGALQKAFEQLKSKLQREGLFDESRKRPLPALPKHIAIVTSPTGAAIRDMLNVLGRRFKAARITVIPCKVQGVAAAREIVEAIALANRLPDVDVMIVGRGGGSIEDLWSFNEEIVARAIADSKIPIISAVGHEVDFTIADFVADLRAPTPSAAAELVVRNAADLVERLKVINRGLRLTVTRFLSSARQYTLSASRRLVDPQRRIQDASLRCDELMQRLEMANTRAFENRFSRIELLREKLGTPLPRIAHDRETVSGLRARLKSGARNTLTRKRERMELNMAVLDSLSPLRVLDRGYSMVMVKGVVVTQSDSLNVGQEITVRMGQGSVEAQITKVEKKR